MKKATCLFCEKEDSTKKMVKQISFIKGLERWFHFRCKGKGINHE